MRPQVGATWTPGIWKRVMASPECVIVGAGGVVWLQTRDEEGRKRISCLGRLPLASVEAFCHQRRLRYYGPDARCSSPSSRVACDQSVLQTDK